MPDLRVLIVDDSVAVRRALGDALQRESGLEVCGTAPNGLLGLELVARSRPDVIVLDLEMPVLDGLEFLARLRAEHPRLPVLVFSGVAGHANEATLEALWRGASDYLLKPHGLTPQAMDAFLHDEMVPRLRALAGPTLTTAPRLSVVAGAAPAAPARTAAPRGPEPTPSVVVIGASTGGPRALATALGGLGTDFPLPIVLVQHMPAEMSEFFAAGLGSSCALPVRLATDGTVVTPGTIWVAPGGMHLQFERDGARVRFAHDHGPERNGCRPSVDPLFASAAQAYGPGVLALVLTGMGHDGLEGARAVVAAQGRVLAQDEASSVVWGMPGAVVRAGLAAAVLPLGEIGNALNSRARRRPSRKAA